MTTMPDQACDCHVHIVGDSRQYPMVPNRPYTPGPASVADLRQHLRSLGMQRAVIIQPSFYGTDNRCLLDALAAMDGDARGIAVVGDATGQDELREMDKAGVRGLRLNLESTGQRDPASLRQSLEQSAARIADLSWHLQVYAAFPVLKSCLPWLGALPVPVVIDHFGLVPLGGADAQKDIDALAQALGKGSLYVKMSGAYRVPGGSPPGVAALAQALVSANADRLLWASDWPHTNRDPAKKPSEVSAYRKVGSPLLLDQLAQWLPDDATARKILRDNPTKLYRF